MSVEEDILQQFADKITHCTSGNLKIVHQYSGKKEKQKIQGMKIPYIVPKSGSAESILSHFSIESVDKLKSSNVNDCVSKQDFHLLPFKKRLLEKTLSKKKIIGWKIAQAIIARKQLAAFFLLLSKNIPQKNIIVKILNKKESEKGKKELQSKKDQEEQAEVLRLQKEERQFSLTRIIPYFTE